MHPYFTDPKSNHIIIQRCRITGQTNHTEAETVGNEQRHSHAWNKGDAAKKSIWGQMIGSRETTSCTRRRKASFSGRGEMHTTENTLEVRKRTGSECRTKELRALKIEANDLILTFGLQQIEIKAELNSFKIWLYICAPPQADKSHLFAF